MKVVLFCGGLGTRLREHSDTVPKSLVPIGIRPIIWHLMMYYAHFGHKDFILALGYRGDMIRDYFVNYQEYLTNDFTLSDGGRRMQLHRQDISDWRITFVDTGMHANLGQRLLRVREHVAGEPMFLANYSDGVTNMPLDSMLHQFTESRAVASFAAMRPAHSFHVVRADAESYVTDLKLLGSDDFQINAGFFAFRSEFFDYLREGEELVEQPFRRLMDKRLLMAYRYSGFWQPMDTFKDKITLDRLEASGDCPWKVWR